MSSHLSKNNSHSFFILHTSLMPNTGKKKNLAAVALSKLGASKGGKARAKKLSAKRRSEIARNAVLARWEKKKLKK
jgi:hypothetical protein